jgi:hypothetical protein
VSAEAWSWAAASRRGRSHELAGEGRQDVQRVQALREDTLLVAVACDGAGSASHGGLGAALTARALNTCAQMHFASNRQMPDERQITNWFVVTRQVIAHAAAKRNLPAAAFATTAVLALSDGSSTTTAHIGDGAVLARLAQARSEDEVQWRALSWPEHGEYVSTTYFVTDADLRLRIAAYAVPVDRLVVFTDGLERLALNFADTVPHTPFLQGMCAPLEGLTKQGCDRPLSRSLLHYLDSETLNDRTDDDKTLILAAFG